MMLGPRLSQQAQAGGGGHAERLPSCFTLHTSTTSVSENKCLSSSGCEHPPIMRWSVRADLICSSVTTAKRPRADLMHRGQKRQRSVRPPLSPDAVKSYRFSQCFALFIMVRPLEMGLVDRNQWLWLLSSFTRVSTFYSLCSLFFCLFLTSSSEKSSLQSVCTKTSVFLQTPGTHTLFSSALDMTDVMPGTTSWRLLQKKLYLLIHFTRA